jgi:hypothetical protein
MVSASLMSGTPGAAADLLLSCAPNGAVALCESSGGFDAPLPYDASFGTSIEGYDGSESPVMFNGGDISGDSWRQYVPTAIWPDREWFDADGNYLGRAGGLDRRKTTVTYQLGGAAGATVQQRSAVPVGILGIER